jgi:hypothetical protein
MKIGYFDPPFPGQAKRHYSHDPSGIEAQEVNHYELLKDLRDNFDGWALSTSVPAAINIVNPIINELFPPFVVREGAWVKPFASWKPTHRVQYTWEPVFFIPSRSKGSKLVPSIRDFIITEPEEIEDVVKANITMRTGTHGKKPDKFNDWILNILGYNPNEDTFEDRYPGSGGMAEAIERMKNNNNSLVIKNI